MYYLYCIFAFISEIFPFIIFMFLVVSFLFCLEKSDLVVMNSFSFCLSVKLLISPSNLRESLAGRVFLDAGFPLSPLFFFKDLICLIFGHVGSRCCTWAFSSCGKRGYSSLWRLLLLQSTGSRGTGFSSCGTQVQ